jgi:ribosomal protein S19E (S16A)
MNQRNDITAINSIRNEGITPAFFTRFAIRNAFLSVQTALLRSLVANGDLSPEEKHLAALAKEGMDVLDKAAAQVAELLRAGRDVSR